MRLEMELSWKHLAIAVIFLGIGAAVGYTVNGQQAQGSLNQPSICPAEMQLAEEDFNRLVFATGFLGGECERRGLVPQALWQDLNGVPYGMPICVEAG